MVDFIDNMKYPDFTNSKIIVIGDIILDQYFCGNVHRISPEAPVPIVLINKKTMNLGGAANVTMNLKGVGVNHILMGAIGDDANGIVLSDILNKNGIICGIVVVQGYPTITKTRVVSQGQQIVRLDEEQISKICDGNRKRVLQHFDENLPGTTGVIVSDYGKGLINSTITRHVIDKCNDGNIPVFIDPKDTSWTKYANAFCITPNIKEFSLIEPFINDLNEKSKIILDRYNFEYILLTRGPEGMTLFNRQHEPIHIKSNAREVFDVSGAGDTVIAFMASAFSTGMSMEKSAEIANIAAGIVVSKRGTKPIEQIELKQIFLSNSENSIKKIVSKEQAVERIEEWRSIGNTIVFTNGCFDIIHVGHIKLIHEAAKSGDRLIIGINSDNSVKRIKGESRPIIKEEERAAILSNIKDVDLIVIFDEETPFDIISTLTPDVIVKGGDWTVETVVGNELVKKVVIVPIVNDNSTTNVIKSIKESNCK